MKKTTMVKVGCAMVMGMASGNMVGGAIAGYLMASVGVAIYNKVKYGNRNKTDYTKVKEMGADVLLGIMSVVAPNMTQYAKNLEYIKEGTKKPFETRTYKPNITYYYKDLATIFGFTQDEMITVLRKYIIKGKYPNVELRNSDWGEYKLTADGKRVYIEYNAECIEYLKVMLAK